PGASNLRTMIYARNVRSRSAQTAKRIATSGGASAADHCDALNLDQHAGAREIRDRDQRARRKIAFRKKSAPQLHEAVAVARIVDEHRHGDHIGEASAGALQGLVEQAEDGTN